MAGLDNIKHFADGGDVEATPDAGAIQTTAPKSTGITGKIALDPTQTEAILSNMQKYIDERSSGWNQFMGGINKAYATTYGPSAVTAYEQQKNQEDKQIMDYRTQMAAYRAAQAQAANEAERYKGMTPGAAGTQPAAGGAQSTAGDVSISPEQLAIENSLGTASEKLESRRKFLAGRNTEKTKKEFSPAMAAVVDIFVPGKGMQQMTVAKAEEFLNADPNLKAVVNGEKVPAAQAITAATTAAVTTPKAETVTFSDPSIKIISGQRSTEEQQKLWDTSVKNGTPGIQPNGLPVAKPGTSPHEKAPGSAYDIDPKTLTKSGRTELAQKGYYQPLGTDSPHWEKIPTTSSAPAEVAVSKPTQTQPAQNPNETRQQYEQRIKETGEIVSSRVKEGEAERNATLQARQSSIDTGNSISRIENTLNTPEGARAVGVFNKKGVVSAFGKILSEGIQAGNFGSVSFKGLEDAVRAAGGDQATIDAAQRLARDFAQMQLNIAKRDLKGQGAVSDNERRIVEHVTGSTSNSPEVLKDFTRWNRVRNTFDKDVGDALQNWEKSHPNQNYYTFKQSEDYKKLEADYIAKTDAMAAKIGVGKKAAPSDTGNKANEYLKKYGPKKES
jgi:D-alanyl-D-alanine carboxypeptidase